MRLARLDLIRYGNFADRRFDFCADPTDLHVLHGPNEAGKSTTLGAISDLLFGFPNLKAQDWRFDAAQLRVGACVEQDDTRLDMVRKRGRTQTLLTPDDATPLDENILLRWLGGVDRAAFERMWSLDHQRLRAGGDAMAQFEGDLGQQLLAAGFGLENVQSVLDALEAEAGAIWKKNGRGTRLNELKNRLAEARSALSKAEGTRALWTALNEETQTLDAERDRIEQAIGTLWSERTQLERLKRLRPSLTQLETLAKTLSTDSAPLFSLQEHEAFDTLLRDWNDAQQKRAELMRHHDSLTALRAGCQPDLALLAQAEEVLAFRKKFEALGPLHADQNEEAGLARLEAELNAAGYHGKAEDILTALPEERLLETLRPLAKTHDALTQREDLWRKDMEAAQERLTLAETRLGSSRSLPTRPLQIALQQAEALGDVDGTVAALEQKCHELALRDAQARRDLLPWEGDPDSLVTMSLPEADFLDQQRIFWRDRDKAITSLEEERQTLEQESERHTLDKTQLEERDIVSEAMLAQERARRDALFERALTASHDPEARENYVQAKNQADHLADRRFENAEDSARLTQIDQALKRCQLKLGHVAERRAELAKLHEEADRQWRAELELRALPALPPERLSGWLELRNKALDSQAALHASRDELDATRARRTASLAALSALVPELANLNRLSDALIAARLHLRDREKHAERLAEREQECELARRGLDAEKRKGGELTTARNTLTAYWSEALPGAPLWSLQMVEDRVQLRAKATTLLHKRKTLTARTAEIASLEASFRLFMTRLGRGDALALASPAEAMASLHDALIKAHGDKEQADRQDEQIRESALAREKADTELTGLQTRLAPFAERLGTTEIDAMRPHFSEEARHYRDRDEKKRLETQILDHSDGLDLAQLQQQAEAISPAQIETRLGALESEQKELERQRNAALLRGGEIKESLRLIEKDEAALDAALTIETCRTEMASAAEDWASARIQTLILTHVARRQRLESTNPLLSAAEAYFTSLTCGRYRKLFISEDSKTPELAALLHDEKHDEKTVRPSAMSEGTRDQLYLSLRLAALDQAQSRGVTLPFIADDLFITFDEARAEAGFATLSALAQKRQILFLTHHAHLADMAARFGATRHAV
ncbi:ATP-binding protein [Asaia astilbis]